MLSWPAFTYKWDSSSFIRKNPCVDYLGRGAIHLLQAVSALDYVGGNNTDLLAFIAIVRLGDCYLMFIRTLTLELWQVKIFICICTHIYQKHICIIVYCFSVFTTICAGQMEKNLLCNTCYGKYLVRHAHKELPNET